MKAWKATLADGVSAAFRQLRPLRENPGCRVLMYHAVGSRVSDDRQHLYNIDPSRFRDHMRYLATSTNHAVVGLSEGVATGKGVAITFDDGYLDTLMVAAPVLVELAFPFTVFVTPGFVCGGHVRYLSATALRELADLPGVTIGAHGNSHRRLPECDDVELAQELAGSRAWLEDALSRPVITMSYPHGAVDRRVRAAAAAAGYELAACSQFGAHRRNADHLQVARTDIWAQDDLQRFKAKTVGAWDWMRWIT